VTAIYALYSEPADVQKAVDNLRAAGVPEREIVVISGEPIEEYEFSHRDKASWLYWIASAGGVAGLTFGTWLTRMTELAWPLQTGNMPIVSWWPNLIVMFELTMLGGILATVVALFITAKIPSREPKLYDPAVTDGKILVGVQNPADATVPALERALMTGGGAELKRTMK
jgi:molybdopterin-containing oxidoreductase family membrane subunit